MAVVDRHVGELAVGGDGEVVGGRADGHALDNLVGGRVDPDQLAGVGAVDCDFNGYEDESLGRGCSDAVRVPSDLDAANWLVCRHVHNGHVVTVAVGHVQLLPNL